MPKDKTADFFDLIFRKRHDDQIGYELGGAACLLCGDSGVRLLHVVDGHIRDIGPCTCSIGRKVFDELCARYHRDTKWVEIKDVPYNRYLQTQHWQHVRLQALHEAGDRCRLCNSREQLDVHHRTYERLGLEHPSDVIVLCRPCHSKYHDKLPAGVVHAQSDPS